MSIAITATGGITVSVRSEPFDPWQALAQHAGSRPGQSGATAVFVGSMRDFNLDETVSAMTLEHYPGMTEKYLHKVCAEAGARWTLNNILVIHRVGALRPGDPIVLVAAWSAHRDAAFAACRYIIDELKTRAPFWKQEMTRNGARWTES